MDFEITLAGEATALDLADGLVTVGGGENDGVRIEGLPPALLRLSIDGERATLTARETVELDGALFPPEVPRLLLPGESVRLPNGGELRRVAKAEARKQLVTAMVLKELLVEHQLEHTRAASLVCLTGLDAGRRYPLAFGEGVIGRGLDAEVHVRDRAVSRHHARLVREADRWFIEDLGGPNGVYVGGVAVKSRRPLEHGDVIELGFSMLRFEGPEAPPEPEPAQAPKEDSPAPEPEAPRPPQERRKRVEWILVGAAAVLAIGGIALSFSLA